MFLADKESVMTLRDTLNFVAFCPRATNKPIAVRRCKLIAKIDEQLHIESVKD